MSQSRPRSRPRQRPYSSPHRRRRVCAASGASKPSRTTWVRGGDSYPPSCETGGVCVVCLCTGHGVYEFVCMCVYIVLKSLVFTRPFFWAGGKLRVCIYLCI